MIDSKNLKNALTVAISMALFYWFSLWMNWEMPKYGGLAIALISQSSSKASVEKGVMRIFGTTLGLIVGLALIALFSQNRWLTLLSFSIYIFIIAYLMQVRYYNYTWFVAGFVPIIAWATSYLQVGTAFSYAVFRYLETSAGIVIYTLVSILLWPKSNDKMIDEEKEPIQHRREHVIQALSPSLSFIVAYIFWIIVNPPTGPDVPMMTAILALLRLLMPYNPMTMLAVLLLCLWLIIAPVYFLIMPALNTGFGLLALIFIYSFVFSLLGKKSMVLKTGPLVLFVMVVNITNSQTYSFMGVMNTSLMIAIALLVIAFVDVICQPIRHYTLNTHST